MVWCVCSHTPPNLPVVQGYLKESPVNVLSDALQLDVQLTGKRKILVMVNSSAISVTIARCSIHYPVCSDETDVLCIDTPIYDVIIGNVERVHAYIRREREEQSDPINHETLSEIADSETMIEKAATIVPAAEIVR